MRLPAHKAGLSIEHNPHLGVCATVEDYFSGEPGRCEAEWPSEEARARAIETGDVWTVRWYPLSPVGFCIVAAPTLAEALAFAADIAEDVIEVPTNLNPTMYGFPVVYTSIDHFKAPAAARTEP